MLHANAAQIDIDRYVYPGHIESRFINHSCDPRVIPLSASLDRRVSAIAQSRTWQLPG